MALADARARAPGLRAVPHDPDGEMALMEKLANACDRYTPMVSIDPPDGLVLDIAGCTHLFGNEDALRQDAVRLMGNLQLQCRAGFADTPEAALALARYAQGKAQNETKAIHGLPLLALSQPADALLALRRAGFSTVGEIAVLPPKVLAARFGAGLVDRLNRLLGRIDSRITPRRLPDPILVERRFAEPVAHVETVMVVLGELLQQACAQLAERHQGGRRFAARLYRSDGAMRDLAVETGEPVRAPKILLRLIEERIDALADPLDPGFGFDLVRLAVPLVETLDAEQAPLDGRKALTGELAALLDRLGARLGAERFCRLVPQDSHIPERTTRLAPAADALAAPARWGAPPLGEPPLRPSTLFDPPERVEVLAEVPDGPPRQFRWRGKAYRIARQEGPERIAAEWWRRLDGHAGNPGLSRDYYRIEDEAGYRFWIFRHGLYGRETDQPHWYVHGLFA
jgi:protein ImuB